jgi:hypothetical protein
MSGSRKSSGVLTDCARRNLALLSIFAYRDATEASTMNETTPPNDRPPVAKRRARDYAGQRILANVNQITLDTPLQD